MSTNEIGMKMCLENVVQERNRGDQLGIGEEVEEDDEDHCCFTEHSGEDRVVAECGDHHADCDADHAPEEISLQATSLSFHDSSTSIKTSAPGALTSLNSIASIVFS